MGTTHGVRGQTTSIVTMPTRDTEAYEAMKHNNDPDHLYDDAESTNFLADPEDYPDKGQGQTQAKVTEAEGQDGNHEAVHYNEVFSMENKRGMCFCFQ